MIRRVLFASFAKYLDDANGACGLRPVMPDHLRFNLKGVPVTILAGSTLARNPDEAECRAFLRIQTPTGFRLPGFKDSDTQTCRGATSRRSDSRTWEVL